MAEVIVALEQLHQNNIVYRDLKTENIIIDRDGHIKLVDFGNFIDNITFNDNFNLGFSKILKDEDKTYTNWGTPNYMAPEIIQKLGHDTTSDIWSLGVFLWEIIGRFPPFHDQNPTKMYENIIHCRIKWPKNMDKIARDLASKMLVVDQNIRITLKEVKNHMFFKVNYSLTPHRELTGKK